jgi:hemerythrin-like domain-containing protein
MQCAHGVTRLVRLLLDEHCRLLATVQQARLALLDGDLAEARRAHADLQRLLSAHAEREERVLIPDIPASARWQAAVYLAEHRKIAQLAAGLRRRLDASGPPDGPTRLALLDAYHPFVHLLEHHFAREEQALFVDVPAGRESGLESVSRAKDPADDGE